MNNDIERTLGNPKLWLNKYYLCKTGEGTVIVAITDDLGISALLIEDDKHNRACIDALVANGVAYESMNEIMELNRKMVDAEYGDLPLSKRDSKIGNEEKRSLVCDWRWTVSLGLNESNEKCIEELCLNIRVRHGVCCRRHHFELIKKRPFPFTENSLTNR